MAWSDFDLNPLNVASAATASAAEVGKELHAISVFAGGNTACASEGCVEDTEFENDKAGLVGSVRTLEGTASFSGEGTRSGDPASTSTPKPAPTTIFSLDRASKEKPRPKKAPVINLRSAAADSSAKPIPNHGKPLATARSGDAGRSANTAARAGEASVRTRPSPKPASAVTKSTSLSTRRGTDGLHDSPLEGNGFEKSVPRCVGAYSTVSGGSPSRRQQLYWFAEANDCSD